MENIKMKISEGFPLGDKYMQFLESQNCVTEQELLTLHRLQEKLCLKKIESLKQTNLNKFFC